MSVASAAQLRQLGENLLVEVKWRQYANDPVLFIQECVKIKDETGSGGVGKRIDFTLYDYQRELLDNMSGNKFVIALKARQLGFTTIAMAYALWLMLFHTDTNVLLMSRSQTAADKNLLMCAQMYQFLPSWLKDRGPMKARDAAQSLAFKHPDGSISVMNSFPPTTTTGAGETATLVILDEFDLYEKVDPSAVWNVIEPTTLAAASNLASNRVVCLIISTARTPDGAFARLWRQADEGEGRFQSMFVPATENRFLWTDGVFDPAKYQSIRDEKKAFGEEWKMFSEYPMNPEEAFKKSGESRYTNLPEFDDVDDFLWTGGLVEVHGKTEFVEHGYGRLRINEMPRRDRFYVMTIDPAQGRGRDSTVMQVLSFDENGETYIAAGWWSNMLEPSDAATEIAAIGRWFKGIEREALLAYDSTASQGGLMLHVWRELGYSNFYTFVSKAGARQRRAPVYGINTAGKSGIRSMMIDKLAEVLPGLVGMYPELRKELGTFIVKPDGRAEADKGCHDDHVMCLAMGVWVLFEKHRAPVTRDYEESTDTTLNSLHEELYGAVERKRAIQKAADSRYSSRLERRLQRTSGSRRR